MALIHPQRLPDVPIVHVPTNFQATASVNRAEAIVAAGGLLSIEAHIVKHAFGHVALDGMDELYDNYNYLDVLFARLRERYGDGLWWTTVARVAERVATGCEPVRQDPDREATG